MLVLPAIYDFQRYFTAADHFDLRALSRYVEWRETTFLANPRLRVARGARAAVASVAPDEVYARAGATPHADGAFGGRRYARRARGAGAAKGVEDAWALLAFGPKFVTDADVLYVSFDGVSDDELDERKCFFSPKSASPCAGLVKAGVVPPQLSAMQDALRWCRKALGEVHAKSANGQPNPNHGIQPHDDCSTRLELGITTPFE